MLVASASERDAESQDRDHGGGQGDRHGLDLNDDASFPVGDAVLDLLPQVLGQDVSTCSRPCARAQGPREAGLRSPSFSSLVSRSSGFLLRI
jgi:hypothetical protein